MAWVRPPAVGSTSHINEGNEGGGPSIGSLRLSHPPEESHHPLNTTDLNKKNEEVEVEAPEEVDEEEEEEEVDVERHQKLLNQLSVLQSEALDGFTRDMVAAISPKSKDELYPPVLGSSPKVSLEALASSLSSSSSRLSLGRLMEEDVKKRESMDHPHPLGGAGVGGMKGESGG
ncbi:hypothetical protein HMI55_004938 [Coelomomyces lativittatus]|nr:hypothetical protein HMI55_004938 [Coelomomyces lativittatus]